MKKPTACFLLLFVAIIVIFAGCSKEKKTSSTGMSALLWGFPASDPYFNPEKWNATNTSATLSAASHLLDVKGIAMWHDSLGVPQGPSSQIELIVSDFMSDTGTFYMGDTAHLITVRHTDYDFSDSLVSTAISANITITAITSTNIHGTFYFTCSYNMSNGIIYPQATDGVFDIPLTMVP